VRVTTTPSPPPRNPPWTPLSMRSRFLIFVIFGSLLVLIGEWDRYATRTTPLTGLNDFWLEFCIGNAGDSVRNPAISLIRIDDGYEPLRIGEDETVADDGRLSRLDFATILGFVGKMNPRSVAFLPTPTFDETLVLNRTDIVPLKDAAMQLPKLTVAATVSNDGERAQEAAPLNFPALKVEGDPSAIPAFSRTIIPPDPQILQNGTPAFRVIESSRNLINEKTIRVPLIAKRGTEVAPSVILAAVANHAGVPLDKIVVKLDGHKPTIEVGEVYSIPIGADGTMTVPPQSGINSSMKSPSRAADGSLRESFHFTSLTVDELAYTGEAEDEVAKRILASYQPKFDSLKENLVVIGFDRTADRRITTARGEILSETTLLARAMAVIQSGRHIEWWPSWARWLSVIVIFSIALYVFTLPRRKFLPLSLVALLAFFTAQVLIFSTTLTWTPPFVAMSLFALMVLTGLAVPVGKTVEKSSV
jgi:hypothetical protein